MFSHMPSARRFGTGTSVSRAWLSVAHGFGAQPDWRHDPNIDSYHHSHVHPSGQPPPQL